MATRQTRGARTAAVVTIAAMLAMLAPVPAAATRADDIADACPAGNVPRAGFPDVGDAATHAAAIDCLVWHGVSAGVRWARYVPGGEVGRDEVATLLARTMERAGVALPSAPGDHFDDLDGNVHARRINQLAELGLVAGTGERRYGPADAVSRAQAATLIVRVFEEVADEPLPATGDDFDDTDGSVHEQRIQAAAAANLVKGTGDRQFSPGRSSTRAQMASLLVRLLDAFAERDLVPLPASWGVDAAPPDLSAELVTDDVAFPAMVTAPADDARLFVVERAGRIRIVEDGSLLPTPFLDLSGSTTTDGERGLFAMAFDPNYADNGRFYVHYTDTGGDTRLDRFMASSDPDRADAASRTSVLAVDQPFSNHNGGMIQFGPDGMLYVALGDGGSGGDPLDHGQNPSTLYGTTLRLDVDLEGSGYRIPPDNPFASGRGGAPEVWAYGLRNHWRFSFDPPTGHLYTADVGQSAREEVNIVPGRRAPVNYGWSTMEGSTCFEAASCDQSGLTPPAYEYGHGEGCSIIGGHVYRGDAMPGLRGHYVFGDLCGGWVRTLRYDGTAAGRITDHEVGELGSIYSFGTDAAGEIYAAAANGVYRLTAG